MTTLHRHLLEAVRSPKGSLHLILAGPVEALFVFSLCSSASRTRNCLHSRSGPTNVGRLFRSLSTGDRPRALALPGTTFAKVSCSWMHLSAHVDGGQGQLSAQSSGRAAGVAEGALGNAVVSSVYRWQCFLPAHGRKLPPSFVRIRSIEHTVSGALLTPQHRLVSSP